MNMVQPGTGLIIAMAQNRYVMGTNTKKGESYFNYSVEQSMGGAEGYSGRFDLQGVHRRGSSGEGCAPVQALQRPVTDGLRQRRVLHLPRPRHERPGYRPRNSTGTNGTMDMSTGIARSVNTYFLQLEHTVGICPVTKMAKKLGVQLVRSEPRPDEERPRSGAVVHPWRLGGHATVHCRGVRDVPARLHCDPIIISKITSRNQKESRHPAPLRAGISKAVADGMNRLLSG